MKNFLIFIYIVIFLNFSLKSIANNNEIYDFNIMLCDSLKNANYNFGVEKINKSKLLIYKFQNNKLKKYNFRKNSENFILNLDQNFDFEEPLYLNLTNRQFYKINNDEFLGGCFKVKSKTELKCKLNSYYNVYNNKPPLACNYN